MKKITIIFNKLLSKKKVVLQFLFSLFAFVLILTFGQYLYDKSLAPVWFNINFWLEANNSEVLRNIIFALGATFGLFIAIWRGWAHQVQSKAQNIQAITAEKSQLTDMFSRAIEQLGNDEVTIRIGGVYTLIQIHNDNFELYGDVIAKTLISHINDKLNLNNSIEQKVTEDIISILSTNELDFSLISIMNCKFYLYNSSFNILEKLNINNSAFDTNYFENFSFKKLRLYKTNFNKSILKKVIFEEIDINAVVFIQSELIDSTFINSKINDLSFEFTKSKRLVFIDSNISKSKTRLEYSSIQFQNCNTNSLEILESQELDASFKNTILKNTEFKELKDSYLNFEKCRMNDTSFKEMHNNSYEFSGINIFDIIYNEEVINELSFEDCHKLNIKVIKGSIEEYNLNEVFYSNIILKEATIKRLLSIDSTEETKIEIEKVEINELFISRTKILTLSLRDSNINRFEIFELNILYHINVYNSSIKNSEFFYLEFNSCKFENTHFSNCKLKDHFIFNNCEIDIIFEGCDLKTIKFPDCEIKRIVLINCDFNYKSFNGIDEHKLFINPDNFEFEIP